MQLALRRRYSRARSTGAAASIALSGCLAVLALRTAHATPELGYAAWSAWGAAVLVVPGALALAVSLAVSFRREGIRLPLLLALAGVASFLPELSLAGARPPLAFTSGLVLAWATPPLAGHLAIVYPGRALRGSIRAICVGGYLCAVVALGALPALFFDPVRSGCGQCSTNLALLNSSTGLEHSLARTGTAAALVWAIVCIAAILTRLARATTAARRLLWPLLAPAAVLIGCFAAELAFSVRRGFLATDRIDRGLWLAGQAMLLAMAVSVAARWLRTRQARGLLARDVVELSDRSEGGTVAGRLSAMLGDPGLEVAYPVGDPERFVDAHGQPVDLSPRPGRVTTVLQKPDGSDRRLAVIRHRAGLLEDPALIEEISRAAQLALSNERLRVDAEARLASLQASRKRIVEAADAERQQLERNLHDGAQQRLVGLAVALRARQCTNNQAPALLDEAQREIAHALEELRTIARGIYPSVLADLGFAAAIGALAETAPLPLNVGPLPNERLDPVAQATAYFVVAESVHDPAAHRVSVTGTRDDRTLKLVVSTDGPCQDLTRLADRVGAVGGTIRRYSDEREVILEVELPCES